MVIKTGRFGDLAVSDADRIHFPEGILGFPDHKDYVLVDPGDDTLILWLQSLDQPRLAFPVLEPKIFRADYRVRLSGQELRALKLESVNQSAVFTILTIPEEVEEMTVNLKAPIVINLKAQVAKQVILQENEYQIAHKIFQDLKTHLLTVKAHRTVASQVAPVAVGSIPPSLTVRP